MNIAGALVTLSLRRPQLVLRLVLVAVVVSAAGFVRLAVDTDPENMLPADDPVRVRNAELEELLGVHPMIVVGLFGPVENQDALSAIDRTEQALAARPDVVAESTFSAGTVFDRWPLTTADVDRIVTTIESDAILAGNVLFAEEPGGALFVALTDKQAATDVADAARELVAAEPALAPLELAVAGQPLAEDAFGQQMFLQMAIFAPLAGGLVFLILLLFFRRLVLVLPAMALAMATVVITMGTLVGTGNTLHIMSSMIPIFLMPVAILDAVHILSELFDRYQGHDRAGVVEEVVSELRRPIGFTTLTTAAGFGSLVLVPIPPVRLFGLFVALGVGLAWLLTLTLLPAMLVSADERRFAPARPQAKGHERTERDGGQRPVLARLERLVTGNRRSIVLGAALVAVVAVPTLSLMTVNDNPVRWFRSDHEIRQATERLGEALPGTFTASLVATEASPGALDRPGTRADLGALAEHLRAHPEVGAVQTYLDGPYPLLRQGEVANLRLQLQTGDNTAMASVVEWADAYLAERPVDGVTLDWAGEAYLNLTWQDKMVSGMLVGFATTLVVIFALLVALFRSVRWAGAAMIPVVWTVVVVYGAMAALGRDLDMPVAVLSTMVLGIGVDFAIHVVERYRALERTTGSPRQALRLLYGEPARAMSRNAIVIALGFLPLVLSSLVPYVVVGVLLATIVGLSWLTSLVILPALALGREPEPELPTPPRWAPPSGQPVEHVGAGAAQASG